MVQLLTDPTFSHHAGTSATLENGDVARSNGSAGTPEEERVMSREEHAQRMRELNMKRAMMRNPRRGWSMTDYQGDANGPNPIFVTSNNSSSFDRRIPIPENSVYPPPGVASPAPPTPSAVPLQGQQVGSQLPQRPKLPAPRRSYSVMDYEPAPPNQPKPSSRLTLLDLPSELHYLFCDYLDPIDSVCFGLAHSKLYAIHRRKYGTVPLSSRYSGPNNMEWAWRGAGPLVGSVSAAASAPSSGTSTTTTAPGATSSELVHMRTRGQVYCRKCGISRCELHRHLKDWMGEGMEYCEIKEVYGKPAGENAKSFCYLSSPKNPNRCGRHGGKKV